MVRASGSGGRKVPVGVELRSFGSLGRPDPPRERFAPPARAAEVRSSPAGGLCPRSLPLRASGLHYVGSVPPSGCPDLLALPAADRLGRFARRLALQLMAADIEVLGIDDSPKIVQELAPGSPTSTDDTRCDRSCSGDRNTL